MTYPTRPETGARSLGFSYGVSAGDVDSLLNRITAIVRDPLGTPVTEAGYAYMGTSRRVGVTLGNGISQTVIDSGDATGLDRFGRVTDLHFKDGSNTVHQYQYGYDISGNRTYARVTQATIGATAHDNDRSYLYGYDDLQRLVLAHMGKLATDNQSILNDPAVALRRKLEWFPDSLGNWSGVDEVHNLADKGLTRTDKTPGQDPITTEIRHEVDAFNRITGVITDSQPVAHVNDSAGNLVFDGIYVYQYDAWNRLVEVNLAGTLTTADFTSDGKISPVGDPIHVIGDLVVRFQYDALGRLIMAQKVHSGSPPAPVYRTEHYYYDGVRRVQEVIQTPGDPTDLFETAHEYVYGPGYVDEFVLESQKSGSAQQDFYILQDANFNVMALTDAGGGVVEQYQWEPYGLLAAKDTDTGGTIPHSHIGHQGLFFYRFNPQTGDTATLSTTAVGLYFNRNRWYSPHLGRFMTRDPRGTSMPGFAQPCPQSAFGPGCDCEMPKIEECQGCGCGGCGECCDSGIIEPCSAGSCFEDGMNLHEYVQSNPVLNVDPAGTFSLGEVLGSVAIGAETDARHNAGVIARGGIIAGFLSYWLYVHAEGLEEAFREIGRTTRREYDRRECYVLYLWCLSWGRDMNCWEALQHCRRNGYWHPGHPPLPPQADPGTPPPGY